MCKHPTRLNVLAAALAACSLALICLPAEAQVLRQLSDLSRDSFVGWSVDDDGSTAVAVWMGDPLGTNPGNEYQIFKWELPGGALTQLTSYPVGVRPDVSISDDGEWIVFASAADPVQENGDGTIELFLMRSDGSDITQLTDDDTLGDGRPECPMISGSGNRVLFYGNHDPTGTNPDHHTQLFVLDLASSNLTQLTQGDSEIFLPYSYQGRCYPAISDDGERVAFSSSADLTGTNPSGYFTVFRIDADGQDLAHVSPFGFDVYTWGISGNGEWIVFVTGETGGSAPIYVVNWEGTDFNSLANGEQPTIDDNGTRVYYSDRDDVDELQYVYYIPGTGGTPRQITLPVDPVHNYFPVVSGSHNRVLFVIAGGEYPGGNNPDGSYELMAMTGSGAAKEQLTISQIRGASYEPDITAGGTRVSFWGHYPVGLYYVDTDGSDPVSVVSTNSVQCPTITADGETIVFESRNDLVGTGTASLRDVFSVHADGTGLAQLTFSDGGQDSAQPVVAANGSSVVFQSYPGSFGGLTGDLFTIPPGGGAATPIVEDGEGLFKRPTVSADGLWAAWHSGASGTGMQVYRGRTDVSLVEQLTDDPDYGASSPDVSGDGRLVAYRSPADPLGTNPDNNFELFLHDAAARSTQQLTVTSEGSSSEARISDDGEWVYFLSSSPFFGSESGDAPLGDLFRVNVATGVIERAGGRSRVSPTFGAAYHPNFAVDADGGRVVFTNISDVAGEILPYVYDLWLADFDTPATIRPGAEAPTVVEWDADPRALHYDVIRGDVASLAAGPGNTVDLGTVVCLENDTLNTNTAGAEADADQPGPGQVFFFLRRWTQGITDGAGSYGQGSGLAERVPSAGDCPH
jgi:Tol biopolymer transport system component